MESFTVDQERKNELGKTIRKKRLSRNLYIEELAKLSGLEEQYIRMLEKGLVYVINPLVLMRIGQILNINYLELYKIVGFIDNISLIKYMIGENDVYDEMMSL